MTLGCKVNQFETETMEGLFRARGYEIVPFEERADVYVINTCSVTHLSDRKSRQIIRRASRTNPSACIAVAGCYAQVAPAEVRALEGVRVVIGTEERARIVDYVEEALRADGVVEEITDVMQARAFEDIPLHGVPHRTRAFLKIEDGCQNFCSFCIIPYARGPVKSRPLAAVAREMEKLAAAGFREVVLTGIHLGAYGIDLPQRPTLADACRTALRTQGLRRLRLGSLESVELSEDLLSLVRTEPRFAPHLHLPLQAGSSPLCVRWALRGCTSSPTRRGAGRPRHGARIRSPRRCARSVRRGCRHSQRSWRRRITARLSARWRGYSLRRRRMA